MATCKDCLHVDVCCSYLSTAYNKCKLATPDFKLLKNIECDECQYFKDRSRFVELPCKVGDHLYVIFPENKYIAEYVVIAFWVEKSGTIIRIVDTRFFTVSILFTRDIGTKAFLTKEEAEQAIAKQNQPDNTPQ